MKNWTAMKLGTFLMTTLACAFVAAPASGTDDDKASPPVTREKLSAERVDELLDLISQATRDLTSLKAEFTQRRHMEAFEDALVSKGTMYFAAPDKIRWELSEPYRSALVFDGERIAKFVYRKGERRKLKTGSAEIMQEVLKFIASWIQGDFESSRKVFDLQIERVCDGISDTRTDGQGNESCELNLVFTPRSSKMSERIRSIELAMRDESKDIDRVTIRESQGDHILIWFADQQRNLELAEDLFALN